MPDSLPLLYAVPGNTHLAFHLASAIHGELGRACVRQFPDGETYVRLDTPPANRDVVVLSTLHHPDDRALPTLFLANTARDLGASRVGLVAPYLAYLRQDRRFQPGEGITSKYFARILSGAFDWVLTVDPHLHRYHSLGEVFTIPATVVDVTAELGAWIAAHVRDPLIVGPDAESRQWADAVAEASNAPVVVLEKTRRGDAEVSISAPDAEAYVHRTPVLVDDIISTAETMSEAARHFRQRGFLAPICVAVHAVMATGALERLHEAGIQRVATANTIPHATNEIDVLPAIAAGLDAVLG
jgi:ribose-phosphate pyrophosphokinase